MPRKQTVFLIHGIFSRGEWFSKSEQTLGPHFTCRRVRYWAFILGPVGVFVGRWCVLAATITLGLAMLARVPSVIRLLFGGCGAVAAALAVFWEPAVRRIVVTHHVEEQITSLGRERVHIVAHSMGTSLLGRIIAASSRVRLNRIVVSGCVIPVDFDWSQHCRDDEFSPIAGGVRNDVCQSDRMVALAGWSERRRPRFVPSPGLGTAGILGFQERKGVVHSIANLSSGCVQCNAGDQASVHNYFLGPECSHSSSVTSELHQRDHWLPFLWGISPEQFHDFVEQCATAHAAEQSKDWDRLSSIALYLGSRTWYWLNPKGSRKTLLNVIRHDVEDQLTQRGLSRSKVQVNELAYRVLRCLWNLIALAHNECEKRQSEQDPKLALMLYPNYALAQAIRNVVRPNTVRK